MPFTNPERQKEYSKEWKRKNAEKMRLYNRDYQTTHRGQINAKHREWKARNKDVVRKSSHLDYEKHKDKRRAKRREYATSHRKQTNAAVRKWRKTSIAYKKWKELNRDHARAVLRSYRQRTNPRFVKYLDESREHINTKAREWRKTSKVHKLWLVANRDKIRINAIRHYYRYRETFREYMNTFGVRKPRRVAIYIKWETCMHLCYICGESVDIDKIHIDHVIPVAKGGSNDIDNLMPTHGACNNKKKDKLKFPVVRPDLIELTKGMETIPRKPARTGGTREVRIRINAKRKQVAS